MGGAGKINTIKDNMLHMAVSAQAGLPDKEIPGSSQQISEVNFSSSNHH